jgi:hypothetical protein
METELGNNQGLRTNLDVSHDISGFSTYGFDDIRVQTDVELYHDGLATFTLLKEGFSQLEELDNMKVAADQISALQLNQTELERVSEIDVSASTLWELQQLDTRSHTDNTNATYLSIPSCLDRFEVQSILRRYIQGLGADMACLGNFSPNELQDLRENGLLENCSAYAGTRVLLLARMFSTIASKDLAATTGHSRPYH